MCFQIHGSNLTQNRIHWKKDLPDTYFNSLLAISTRNLLLPLARIYFQNVDSLCTTKMVKDKTTWKSNNFIKIILNKYFLKIILNKYFPEYALFCMPEILIAQLTQFTWYFRQAQFLYMSTHTNGYKTLKLFDILSILFPIWWRSTCRDYIYSNYMSCFPNSTSNDY